jgi:hypothetical protein
LCIPDGYQVNSCPTLQLFSGRGIAREPAGFQRTTALKRKATWSSVHAKFESTVCAEVAVAAVGVAAAAAVGVAAAAWEVSTSIALSLLAGVAAVVEARAFFLGGMVLA